MSGNQKQQMAPPKIVYKIVKAGEDTVEIEAESEQQAMAQAHIPDDWQVTKAGAVITAFPRVRGG